MSEEDLYIVTASEIATWAFCPESWRLQSLKLGDVDEDSAALARGIEHHARTAIYERLSRFAIACGWSIAVTAVVLMAYTLVRSW